MATPADAVIGAARSHIGETQCLTCCASFVSSVFAEAKVYPVIAGRTWSASSWVPTIVGEFPASQQSTGILDGLPGDLVIFGDNEHIMLYAGSGHVVGTGTGKDGITRVVEVLMKDVVTATGKGFSRILFTGLTTGTRLGQMDYVGNQVVAAGGSALGDLFGSMFAWVPGFAVNAAILVLALVLVLVGVRETVASVGD